jgi:hypothetical protein
MECSIPPELTEDDLSDAIDGEADGSVLAHLKQCPHCSARLRSARKMETRLQRKLFRFNCPPSQQLTDFTFNFLTANEQTSIAAHVQTCPRCQKELEALEEFKKPFVETRDVSEKKPILAHHPARVWYPRLTQGTALYAARGALRGDDPLDPLMFEVKGITIFLGGEEIDGTLWLSGRLLTPDLSTWKDALVELTQDESVITVAAVDESASFRCRLQNEASCTVTITSKTGIVLKIENIKVVN